MSLFVSLSDVPEDLMSDDALGGKAFNLAKMIRAGINVPSAYVIPTAVCVEYMKNPEAVMAEVKESLPAVLNSFRNIFGYDPLLSVRSGAKFSMPGMMDTILNVGITTANYSEWCDRLGGPCAANSAGRLGAMYNSVVGALVPDDTVYQLLGAIEAVFKSWNNERAKSYRRIHNISDSLGTAVVLQAMVFGNMNESSCTGVLFSRNPSTGAKCVTGEFLVNAQGEDVVDGTVTPKPLTDMSAWNLAIGGELLEVVGTLEDLNKDMQDIEFTVQDGELFILQTRNGKRTPQAAVKIAGDLLAEGKVDARDIGRLISYEQFTQASKGYIPGDFKAVNPAHVVGIPASSGCVTGVMVLTSGDAVNCKVPCVLVTNDTSPDDIEGMYKSVAILTKNGGYTCHAAVVARGAGVAAVVGCGGIEIAYDHMAHTTVVKVGFMTDVKYNEGDKVTIDGDTGEVWFGIDVPIVTGDSKYLSTLSTLLFNEYGVYKVCSSEEDVKGIKNVLISVSDIEATPGVKDVPSELVKVLNTVESDVKIVVDLRDRSYFNTGAIHTFFTDDRLFPHVVKAIKSFVGGGKVVVLGAGLTDYDVDLLNNLGLKMIKEVKSINELIKIKGLCNPNYDSILKNSSEEDVTHLVDLKAKAGEPVHSFNLGYEVDVEAVSRGAVFACGEYPFMESILK